MLVRRLPTKLAYKENLNRCFIETAQRNEQTRRQWHTLITGDRVIEVTLVTFDGYKVI
jgi:hypothetical protein